MHARMYICLYLCMDGWTDGSWMDGGSEGRRDGWTDHFGQGFTYVDQLRYRAEHKTFPGGKCHGGMDACFQSLVRHRVATCACCMLKWTLGHCIPGASRQVYANTGAGSIGLRRTRRVTV